jgi:alpha-L-fucosidase
VFFFDWWIEQPAFKPYLRRFASYYYNRGFAWGKGVVLHYKLEAFPIKAAVFDVERGNLAEIRQPYWQSDTAVAKNSWSNVAQMDYKTAESLIHDLIDIVSKNGCLLLNIGPRADGTIPDEDASILREIGSWLAVNGEAIYGTRPWKVFGEGPTKVVAGTYKDVERSRFTVQDIRFTTKGGFIYAIVLSDAAGEVSIQSLGEGVALETNEIESVDLLGHAGPVTWYRDRAALNIEVPAGLPSSHALSFKIKTAPATA